MCPQYFILAMFLFVYGINLKINLNIQGTAKYIIYVFSLRNLPKQRILHQKRATLFCLMFYILCSLLANIGLSNKTPFLFLYFQFSFARSLYSCYLNYNCLRYHLVYSIFLGFIVSFISSQCTSQFLLKSGSYLTYFYCYDRYLNLILLYSCLFRYDLIFGFLVVFCFLSVDMQYLSPLYPLPTPLSHTSNLKVYTEAYFYVTSNHRH